MLSAVLRQNRPNSLDVSSPARTRRAVLAPFLSNDFVLQAHALRVTCAVSVIVVLLHLDGMNDDTVGGNTTELLAASGTDDEGRAYAFLKKNGIVMAHCLSSSGRFSFSPVT